MWREFIDFFIHRNTVDYAIGVIVGAVFGKAITSLVNDIMMPPIGGMVGDVDFSNLFINLSHTHYDSVAQAKAAGAATINYGAFLNNLLELIIVVFLTFFIFRIVRRLKRNEEFAPVTTKRCPYCRSLIPLEATRCGHCTSHMPDTHT